VQIAAAASAAAAGAPLVAAAAGTTVGAAASTVGTAVASAVSTVGATIGSGVITAFSSSATFLGSNLGIATTVSSAFLPKAIELVEKEVGGFSQVQKEVVTILSSPTITDDVRKEGLSILQRLGAAFMADQIADEKAKEKEEKERLEKEKEAEKEKVKEKEKEKGPGATLKRLKTISRSNSQNSTSAVVKAPPTSPTSPSSELQHRPTLRRVGQTTSAFLSLMSAEGRAAHQAAKREAKEEKEVASWEVLDLTPDDEPMLLSSRGLLRLHGLFVGERKHFEVREKNGKLVLVDALTGSTLKE